MNKERGATHKVNQEAYALVFKALLDAPQSTYELAEVSGMHIVTVQSLARTLKRHRVVHISAWDVDGMGRDTTPILTLGQGHNAPRRRKSRKEINATYVKRRQMKLMTIHANAPAHVS